MNPEDYDNPLFAAANTSELKQHLIKLKQIYEPSLENQPFRILRDLQNLARNRRGLRFDTKYGIGSYCDHHIQQDTIVFRVVFDGDSSSTGVSPSSIRTFWFEME